MIRPSASCILTKGQIATYDLEDANKVIQHRWHAWWNKNTRSYYARTGKTMMSRFIMGLQPGDKLLVDHINHDTLDNRKENLRIVTTSQNNQNRRNVKGYSWDKRAKKWQVKIRVNYKLIHVGLYSIEAEARKAYLKARKEHGFIN